MIEDYTCTCLALYDWGGEIDTVQFHELAREFFEANGLLPNLCSVMHMNGKSRDTRYSASAAKLESEPLPSVEGLAFYHTLPKYAQLVFGWDVTAAFDCHESRTMYFCCNQGLRGLELNYFENLLDRISEMVTLRYGIGYLRPFRLGPAVYAYGMSAGLEYSDEEMAQADRIASWLHERIEENRHLTGCLRDVYPLSVVSEVHLSKQVDGMPLADWIAQKPTRGTLRRLRGEACVWRVEDSEVERLRSELAKAGLLIAYPPTND